MRLQVAALIGTSLLLSAVSAKADLVTNGTFDSGDLTGWTVFTTSNGTTGAGLPVVTSFDTTGSGASNAAEFNVGELSLTGIFEGGGLSQTISVPVNGFYTLTESFADLDDASGGINHGTEVFSIVIDGTTVATQTFGAFSSSGQVQRGSFDESVFLNAGIQTFATEITRIPESGGAQSPTEYVDDISLDPTVAPEPGSFVLLGSSLLGLAGIIRRRI